MKQKILARKITGNNRKIMVTWIVLLLLGLTMIPIINSSSTNIVSPRMQDNKQGSTSLEFLDSKMIVPEHCHDLSKAPTYYEVDDKLIAEEFNFPIGTFGNNYISYGPHGIDRIALYNNWFDSFGGSHGTGADNPQCLNGTFLGVFMNNSGKKVSRILQQYPPTDRNAKDYGLQTVEKMDCYSNIPIGYYQYQDSEFSAEIGLNVFSPVILYDIKNSSMPVSTWVFNAYNPTNKSIEVSFLFSLENDIGWRHKEKVTKNDKGVETTSYKYTWQRTGTYNYIQENKDMIGVKFTYDENLMSKSHPEYLGNMTLATIKQSNVTISYISEWDTLGDGNDLLSSFTTSGVLSNQNNSNRATEEEHIYAGAISAKVVLKPGEGKNIPFVLATCFPIFNLSNKDGMSSNEFYNWSWTKYFNDSWSIAEYSLNNYENWWTSINDWHEKLYNSGLPPEIMTFMLGSLSTFVSCVFFSADPYWFTAFTGIGYLENGGASLDAEWFLCMFYPEFVKYSVLEYCEAVEKHNGFCPASLWNRPLIVHREPGFIIRAYRAWIWNQSDDEFLQTIYPTCKKAIEYRMKQTGNNKDGLIHNLGNDHYDGWSIPTSSSLNSKWLLSLKCMASMAKHLKLHDDSEYFEEWFEKAQKSFINKFWYEALEYEYFKLCAKKIGWFSFWAYPGIPSSPPLRTRISDSRACTIKQIIGTWYGRLMDDDILPLGKTKTALNSIYEINRDYHHKLGWITSVMGNPPYRIDRFATSLNNGPNSIGQKNQWTLATSLLTHGYKEEGMNVANVAKESYLYKRSGGVYVTHKSGDSYGFGTNKINIIKTWTSLKSKILKWLIFQEKFGDKGWAPGAGYYPPKVVRNLPCWSLYQGASGFTPCVGGLKIKPRLGGDNVCYITQFAGCKIEMNVTGTGDYIDSDSVEINGEPYHVIIDGNVFIPLEDFTERDEMFIHINLS
ncbi:MAG: hypothetical protein KAW45_06035 [Thermoplasmatales archaeon]|nr:hypothetical protein [Thermoplasmatales archaeon]